MKKVLITSILILAIISSLLAGTVSYYTTTIDVAAGSVTAKEFIFASEHKENSFTKNTKIAPGESVKWSFQVMNHENGIITETDLYYKLTFTLNAADGKNAIVPVKANIRGSEDGSILATATHGQPASITDEFLVAVASQAKDYFVEIVWPHGDNDIDYAGNGFGNSVKVSAIASQVPFDSETQPVEPEEPGEPGESEEGESTNPKYAENIKITYYTTGDWGQYNYRIKIDNIGSEDISDWKLSFRLAHEEGNDLFNAHLTETDYDLKTFTKPAVDFNNIILGNNSISFGGQFIGENNLSPTDFEFNGLPVNEADISITLRKDK